jgi:hypothetical protein
MRPFIRWFVMVMVEPSTNTSWDELSCIGTASKNVSFSRKHLDTSISSTGDASLICPDKNECRNRIELPPAT